MLEEVAAGKLAGELPAYTDPYDPASPWSIVLAFMPETVPAGEYVRELASMPSSHPAGKPLDPAVKDHITRECAALGWPANEDFEDAFVKAKVRQIDAACAKIEWPNRNPWYVGVAHVLALYRQWYHSSLSLKEFEANSVEQNVALFLDHSKDLRRDVDFLVLPYLTYHNQLPLLSDWVRRQPLASVVRLAPVKEVAPAIMALCYQASPDQWRTVRDVVSNLAPASPQTKNGDNTSNKPDHSASTEVASTEIPSKTSIKFLEKVAESARILAPLQPSTLQQIADWSFAGPETQQDLLMRYLRLVPQWNTLDNDLRILKETVLRNLDQQVLERELFVGALHGAKFSFLQTHTAPKQVTETEVKKMVEQFDNGNADFKTVLAALDVVAPGGSLDKDKQRFAALNMAATKFKVDPARAVRMQPLELIQKALESPGAYTKVTDLSTVVNQLYGQDADLSRDVREQCITMALANGRFDIAYNLCDSLSDEPESWLPLFQVGEHRSPETGEAVDLDKQRALISRCLRLCAESDMLAVLKVWERLETESRAATPLDSLDSFDRSHSASPGPRDREIGREHGREHGRKHNQLQNLLIGGIGWAIGAPVE